MYTFFPLITVGLLKGVKFIDSIFLKTQRDRIIPYIACNIWYFWAWWVLYNLPGTASQLVYLSLGIFLSCTLGFLTNIMMKVSMHAMSMGLVSTFMVLMAFSQDMSFTAFISITVFITGLVCTARLLISDHRPNEIYTGLLIGMVSQLFAYWIT